jgi:hypothetical protein
VVDDGDLKNQSAILLAILRVCPPVIFVDPYQAARARDIRRQYRSTCSLLKMPPMCACTQRRNCIGQLSPFSEYAPTALRNKWKPAATIKLIQRLGAKPHESSASGGFLGIRCLQRFQNLDATRNWTASTQRSEPRASPPA